MGGFAWASRAHWPPSGHPDRCIHRDRPESAASWSKHIAYPTGEVLAGVIGDQIGRDLMLAWVPLSTFAPTF